MPLDTRDCVKAQHIINTLIEEDKANKFVFPSSIRIKLAGNLRKTRPVVEDYLKEHESLVKRLGEPLKDKPDQIMVKAENANEFTKENEGMLAEKTDITLNPITEKDLGENQLSIDLIANLQDVGLLA